jgi:hypothetical protein
LATLVLSTVGTALGGPVGSAIGALIGQSIDQQLLAPARRGPRVGDLSVQTSGYGTQIPRIYGKMRAAGSVVWSTDLIEHENTDGAKGQPDVTYSYTVSFAVALSSRTAKSIKRIWADGKLLRGEAGDFKVGTTFRFHDGSEDQIIDPLIGSVEGIASTPAYRGVALAVFEDLELAEFGNRIPFLTFEIEADGQPQTVGSVLTDASASAISSDADDVLLGFAAYGGSIKAAIQPLVECFGVELFDDGSALRPAASGVAFVVGESELGNSADNDAPPRLHREQLPIRSVPSTLRVTFYDPSRDYQTGETRAVVGEQWGVEAQRELAAVLSAADAKSLAQNMLAKAWSARDKLTLRLLPRRLSLEPGAIVDLPLSPSRWTVEKTVIDSFVAVVELRPSGTVGAAVPADGGRIAPNPDVVAGPVTLALLDVPTAGFSSSQPTVLLAASTPTAGWKRRTVQISFGAQTIGVETARSKNVLGHALTPLGSGTTELIDSENTLDVALLDADQWLTSCDDEALAAGENLAVLGLEVLQFGQVSPLGGGQFRLTRLLRGRGGTEWACSGHGAGEVFCLIKAASLQSVTLPGWSIGATVTAMITGGNAASISFGAEGLRPPSPINLAAERQSGGDFAISWTRRSRQGFAWVDGTDAPLGEAREQYSVTISGSQSTIELSSDQCSLVVPGTTVASVGTGPASIEVRQIGDFAASHPAQLVINLS